ncbi:MAG: sulfurtransferase TusA family protein [Elusimicrobia bacterium]|nr:sulfurtransferase TusA family protein [Elusimicrobiota bacterium]
MSPQKAAETLDLSGVPCPQNAARALLRIEGMAPGSVLAVILDDGEPIRNVPPVLEAEGHKELFRARENKGWRLVMRRGDR